MSTNSIHNNPSVGASQGAANNSAASSSPTGDDALMKAMLIQILELNVLGVAADSENELSVALRQTMQETLTERLEEIQKLMQLGADCEGGANWQYLQNFVKTMGNLPPDRLLYELQEQFPDLNLQDLNSSGPIGADFISRLKDLFNNPDPSHVTDFRTQVGNLGTELQQYGTFQTSAKNLADAYQNGAGSLTQSITQFLAQLATESGLMSDVVGQ